MNAVVLILAIVVIILFYILYRFFMLKSTELTSTASLLDSNPSIKIENNPSSTRYSYGIWIYVNSWDTSQSKTIFERANNIKLYFSEKAPVLNCDITMDDGQSSTTGAPTTTIEITDNFPIQKWVHIVTSVDNQYLDAYLDGKLVKSKRMYTEAAAAATVTNSDGSTECAANHGATNENPLYVCGSEFPTCTNYVEGTTWGTCVSSVTTDAVRESTPKAPGDGSMVIGGGTNFDAYIAKFNHWSSPLNPQSVWSTYKEGNGQSSMNNYISAYGIDLSILKDNVEQSKYSIL